MGVLTKRSSAARCSRHRRRHCSSYRVHIAFTASKCPVCKQCIVEGLGLADARAIASAERQGGGAAEEGAVHAAELGARAAEIRLAELRKLIRMFGILSRR